MPSTVPRARARVAPAPQRQRRAIVHWSMAHRRQATSLSARAHAASQQCPHAGDRYCATHRALPARLPSYADYILRLQDTEPERASRSCCAFCSSHYHSSSPCRRCSTNRRSTPFSSSFDLRLSSRCDLRPSPALFAPPPLEINTIAPPQHTPLRTHTTRQAHTSLWTRRGTRMQARRSTP